jgi:hypothetical protein
MTSPLASPGNHFAFCSLEPNNRMASAHRQTEDRKGTGASARPISSAATHSSNAPRPIPECSSEMAMAWTLISANPFQIGAE